MISYLNTLRHYKTNLDFSRKTSSLGIISEKNITFFSILSSSFVFTKHYYQHVCIDQGIILVSKNWEPGKHNSHIRFLSFLSTSHSAYIRIINLSWVTFSPLPPHPATPGGDSPPIHPGPTVAALTVQAPRAPRRAAVQQQQQ